MTALLMAAVLGVRAPMWAQSASTGRLAFTARRDGINRIMVAPADGSTAPVALAVGWYPAWSPDGGRIAYAAPVAAGPNATPHDEILIMDADGANPRPITQTRTGAAAPAWSPNGKRIAFVSLDPGYPEIFVIDAEPSSSGSAAPVRLTHDTATDPAWSPDGNFIAFTSLGEIYRMNADGSNVIKLTHNHAQISGAESYKPAWSPDGKQIAFTFYVNAHDALYVMDADGGNMRRLSGVGNFNHRTPAWSPDGQFIAFSMFGTGSDDIYMMKADGSAITRLRGTTNGFQPAWAP